MGGNRSINNVGNIFDETLFDKFGVKIRDTDCESATTGGVAAAAAVATAAAQMSAATASLRKH